ncbi:T9SS type A sorting domain-containing protein [Hymenobacter sp. DH14]|uniref:T9SS type A sorting domain-containing protein n=1 Tax=Hymenobacter cyanobacteriorum TaxID=2926463 RepID=A0A9X1VE55_9BACT|nr:T9SS type A sorting domain-containing protein [Hymenobacter cyanobacteriorum]MCI1187246.1 T9SS type A sorting domain-containing protein [Hymenobacter cyanobacteriorum]
MTKLYFAAALLLAAPAAAQDLTNAGAAITIQPGAAVYVGTGGFANQTGGTLTNGGTLRVDGPTTNAGTLDLGSGTLEVRGDLANTGTLLPGASAVTFSGVADQLLTPGGATLYQLLLNKPTAGANTLRLAGDLTVSNLLSLSNGLLNTKNGSTLSTLRLPNGAALSGEATGRYVLGALEITRNGVSGAAVDYGHGAVLDPAGNNLGTVAITRVAGLTTADVSFGQNLNNAGLKGIDRIWTVAPAAQPAAGQPVQLTLSWLPDNDNGLTDFSQARIYEQTAAGQPWAVRSAVANASGRSISGSFASLARFTVSNAANPLPVTLVDFAARAEGPAAVRLNWTTASELNNAGFTVERSLDARAFAAIGTVAGAGTSTARHDYALLDAKLPGGATLLYYRLRQTDAGGEVSYSPIRTVALSPVAAGFAVYPTKVPVGATATYLYTGPAEAGTLEVLDLLGRAVRSVAVDGRATGTVPLAGLASGSYLLRYTTATARFAGRCVVE